MAITSRLLHKLPPVTVNVSARFKEQHKLPSQAIALAHAEAEYFECVLTLFRPRASKHPISHVARDVSERYALRLAESLRAPHGVIIDIGGRNRHGIPHVFAMQPSTLPQDVGKSQKRVSCRHTIQTCDCFAKPSEISNVAVATDSAYYFRPEEALPFLQSAQVTHLIINQWCFDNGSSANLGEAKWTVANGTITFTLEDSPAPSVYVHGDPWFTAGKPAPLPGYHSHIVKMSPTRVVVVYERNNVVSSFAPLAVEPPVAPVVEPSPTAATAAALVAPLVPPPLSLPSPVATPISDPPPSAKASATSEITWREYHVRFPKRYHAMGFTAFLGATEVVAQLPSEIVNLLACSFRAATSSNMSSMLGRAQRLFREHGLESAPNSAQTMHLCVAQAISEGETATHVLSMGNFGQHASSTSAAASGFSFDRTAIALEATSLIADLFDIDSRRALSKIVTMCGGVESTDVAAEASLGPVEPLSWSAPSAPPPSPTPDLCDASSSCSLPTRPAFTPTPFPAPLDPHPESTTETERSTIPTLAGLTDQHCAGLALVLSLAFYFNFWLSLYLCLAFMGIRFAPHITFNVDSPLCRELKYLYIRLVHGTFAATVARGCDNLASTIDGVPSRARHAYQAFSVRAKSFLCTLDPQALLDRFPRMAAAAALALSHYMPDVKPRDIVERLKTGVGKRLRSGVILPPSATDQRQGDRIAPSISGLSAPDLPSEVLLSPKPGYNMVVIGPAILPASCPAACSDNIQVAVHERIEKGSASTYTSEGQEAMQVAMHSLTSLVPATKHFYRFVDWVAKYPPAKRERLNAAHEKYLADGIVNYPLTGFLKSEAYFKAPELQKPRIICSSDDSYVVVVARYLATIGDMIATVYGPSKHICFYSRMGQAHAGAWVNRYRAAGYRFFEGDASAFDSTQKHYIGKTRIDIYEKLGLPAHIKAMLTKRNDQKKIVFADGTQMSVVGQTDSGAQDTKSSNDLANASALIACLFMMIGYPVDGLDAAIRANLAHEFPFFAVMTNGDDNVVAIHPDIQPDLDLLTQLVASIGYRYNFIDRRDFHALTFNSAIFWPATLTEELIDGDRPYASAGETLALLPSVGRTLARLPFSCQDLADSQVRGRMIEKCRALSAFAYAVPVLGQVVTYISQLPLVASEVSSNPYIPEYDWPTKLPLTFNQVEMEAFFYQRYGIDFSIEELVRDYLTAFHERRSLGDHPGFVAMAKLDMDL